MKVKNKAHCHQIAVDSENKMGFVIIYRGFRVECDTPAEAEALMDRLRGKQARLTTNAERPWELLVKALEAINASGKHGIQSADLAKAIGLTNGRAVGPKTRIWFRLLEDLGFKPTDVLEARRVGARQRRWFPGKKIRRALKAACETSR